MTTYWTVVTLVIGAALLTLLAFWSHVDPGGRRLDRRWVALGTSGVARLGTRSWVAWITLRRPAEAIDLTAPGATIADVRASQLGPALAANPAVAVIWLGVSDLLAGTSLATFQRELTTVIALLQQRECQVVLLALPAFHMASRPSGVRRRGALSGTVDQWRATIEATTRLTGVTLVEPGGRTSSEPIVHLEGSIVWFDERVLSSVGRAIAPLLDRLLLVGRQPQSGPTVWDEPADPVERRRLGRPPVR